MAVGAHEVCSTADWALDARVCEPFRTAGHVACAYGG